MEQKYIYALILGTPFNTGKFIRLMTGYPYNHGAISFSPNIENMYSFARRYKSTPFYSGFVTESVLRYKHKGTIAVAKIFKIPVSEKQYGDALKRIEYLDEHRLEYLYNFASAFWFPIEHTVNIPKAYTCIEFVLSMLNDFTDIPELKGRNFISIKQLDEVLESYKIYEGSAEPFLKNGNWEKDPFEEQKSLWFGIKNTAAEFLELFLRYIKR